MRFEGELEGGGKEEKARVKLTDPSWALLCFTLVGIGPRSETAQLLKDDDEG
jgi:hypothetical protein